jgi:hypothetical protein
MRSIKDPSQLGINDTLKKPLNKENVEAMIAKSGWVRTNDGSGQWVSGCFLSQVFFLSPIYLQGVFARVEACRVGLHHAQSKERHHVIFAPPWCLMKDVIFASPLCSIKHRHQRDAGNPGQRHGQGCVVLIIPPLPPPQPPPQPPPDEMRRF